MPIRHELTSLTEHFQVFVDFPTDEKLPELFLLPFLFIFPLLPDMLLSFVTLLNKAVANLWLEPKTLKKKKKNKI